MRGENTAPTGRIFQQASICVLNEMPTLQQILLDKQGFFIESQGTSQWTASVLDTRVDESVCESVNNCLSICCRLVSLMNRSPTDFQSQMYEE